MNKDALSKLIKELIDARKEGEWWDFKECHHSNNVTLIHDIICMSNQPSNNNAFLIYGIRDKTYEVIGVENDKNRKQQQFFIDLLKSVPFAGDYRPDISLDTIELFNHEIDVLTIYNSTNVPLFLKEDYPKNDGGRVFKGNIYTRIGDTNTPINRTADYHRVERLWRKRFGLDSDVMTKLNIALDDYENWVFDWGNKKYAYNKKTPEFQMIIPDVFVAGWWPCAAFYTAPIMHMAVLNIMVYNTIIYETEIWALDEFKKYLPKATNAYIYDKGGKQFFFQYYLLNTIEGKMLRIFTNGSFDLSSRELDFNQILIFNDENELESFKCFYEDYIADLDINTIAEQFKYQISQDIETNGGGIVFSTLQVAIAGTAYRAWRYGELNN